MNLAGSKLAPEGPEMHLGGNKMQLEGTEMHLGAIKGTWGALK